MKKITLSLHTSLDGFVAGPKGEMDWIIFDQEMFDLVGTFTEEADTALYGRVTYQMMENYWPTAADKPDATKHDIEHSRWYNKVDKIVLSKTMQNKGAGKTRFIHSNVNEEIRQLKNQSGGNILIFGSPTVAHYLMAHNLIDYYWLFVNPVLIGQGIPLFAGVGDRIGLKLLQTRVFSCGVAGLNYALNI
jgi:dihydrofolate reductase